ncbi:MAG: hypothetical protein KDK70_23545, partial [Myxococcales bacterium]|nr:hypothetical protein [Myxococcales bacterium]
MRRRLCVWGLSLLVSCGDDATGVPEAATDTGTDGSTSTPPVDDTAVDATGSSSGAQESSGSTTAPAEPPLPFASGIRLERVTANQGVQVPLVEQGVEVPPEAQSARLIAGRTTLLRGFWSLHADFTPRELIGRLVADYPDGTQLVQDFPLMVEGESTDGGASFQWLLQPDQVVPGIQYRVRILEADPEAATGEVSDPPPILPLAGQGTLEVYDVPLQMKVELIPVLHQLDGMECMPEILDEDVTAMREQLEQNNPVQQAVITVGEPMPYTASISEGGGFSPVLSVLAERRAADDPDPNVYYYGLLDSCDGYPPGLLGQAIGIPPAPTMELAQQRIATGRWLGSGAAAAETFVHEIGHTQGRYHVLCSGGEAGADAAYPHPQGRIGVWGFGIHDFQLRSPTQSRDYMTYCANEWVSDYGYNLTAGVIEQLSAWALGAGASAGADRLRAADFDEILVASIEASGAIQWFTIRGGLSGELDAHAAIRWQLDGAQLELPVWISDQPDGDALLLTS